MSNNPFPLEDGDPGTPFYGAHADRDGSESKTKELHAYLAAVVDWPEDAVQVVARLRAEAERLSLRASQAEALAAALSRLREAAEAEVERLNAEEADPKLWSNYRKALVRAERAESNARGKQAVIEAQRATLDRVRALADEWVIVAGRQETSAQRTLWEAAADLGDILAVLDAPQPEAGGDDE